MTTPTQKLANSITGAGREAIQERTQHAPGLSEQIIQHWFSGTSCPELTRLADAAPDLLAELKQVLEHGSAGNENLIRAAIAKAEKGAQ